MSVESALVTEIRTKDLTPPSGAEYKTVTSLGTLPATKQPQLVQSANEEKLSEVWDNTKIRKTLDSINELIPIANTNLVFAFDELGDPPIIQVIDKDTKELIREIPSQELAKIAKAFSEMVDKLNKSGVLFNLEA